MVNAPISIPLAITQSRKPSDLFQAQSLAADALKIERYINSQMAREYIRQFDFSTLAQALALDQQRVQALLNRLAEGSQELTVRNPNNKPKTPVIQTPGTSASNNRRQCWPPETTAPAQR
jgi:hypothetical protein